MRRHPDAAAQIEAIKASGRDVPQHLERPALMAGAEEWSDAFWELSTDRQIGMALGPIPAAAIDRMAAGMAPCEAADFRHCIREMDAVFRGISVEPMTDGEFMAAIVAQGRQ